MSDRHPSSLKSALCAAALALYVAAPCAKAQAFDGHYRTDTSLVLVPVTVTDPHSAQLTGLGRDRFAVLDNGRLQPIQVFYTDDAPCTVGIVLDVSGSMAKTLDLGKAAIRAFLRGSNPEDEFFLETVSSRPGTILGPVDDAGRIEDLTRATTAGGGTALFDTIALALQHGRGSAKRRRALLVISDGMDNVSRYSKRELMNMALESDTQVYTMAITGGRSGAKGAEVAEIQRGLQFLEDLAAETGGMNVRLGSVENPAQAAGRLAGALRNQYVIGYQSPNDGQTGKWHRIQVKVNWTRANVYARRGYQGQ